MSASEGIPSPADQTGQNAQASAAGAASAASQNGQAAAAPAAAKPELFRSPMALVIWWVWAVFAAANLIDIAVQGRDHFSAVVAAVLILITGVTYVAAFRPRVLADALSLRIVNPLRNHQIPWAAVDRMDLGDSLEVHCSWQEAGAPKSKKLYGWAVHSPRRSRLKAELRAQRGQRGRIRPGQPAGYARMPEQAQAVLGRTDAENIVAMLEKYTARLPADGAPAGPPVSSWHWPSVAALLLPAVLLTVLALT